MEIRNLSGVGPKAAARLAKLGIRSTRDLCEHYPMRYEDRSRVYSIGALPFDTPVSVRGTLISVGKRQTRRRNITLITAGITDGLDTLRLVWFNGNYLLTRLQKLQGKEVTVYGSATMDSYGPVMTGADVLEDPDTDEVIVPVYNLTDGISQNQMRRFVRDALAYEREFYHETLPLRVRKEYGLEGLWDAVHGIHYPESPDGFLRARDRLAFEELFVLQLALVQRKQRQTLPGRGISFQVPEGFFAEFRSLFPFPLTEGQKRSIGEIIADMRKPDCMNRLLQGDVGSGKTITALAGMLLCCKNGMQAAIMAPTEILAEQHYLSFRSMLGDKAEIFRPALLTGSLKASERKKALEGIESGEVKLVIGTHALIADKVCFHRLGLVVVDEQHRFGVRQRTALYGKAQDASPLGPRPDMLLMTATPIPRTLTNAVYGDLDISIIDTMPPGRRPVRTHWKKPEERPRVYKA
ncbi:MAG: DEAD/DEAH box helicase, partial [Abditibacteriota bacterium]|nr:DEAD/DEAH box helicase [Abditibacteriota bacterium]